MINNKTVTLVIPCRNEEHALGDMLKHVPALVDEVIVVDNNSSDSTAKVARKMGARVFRERRVDRFNIGYGYAHQKGIKNARGDIIVALDGDGTYPLHAISKAINKLEKQNLDFVSCNRFPLRNSKAISKLRQFGVWLLNTEVAILYWYPIKDILSGMWVMTKGAAKELNLKEGGWNLSPEIKLSAIRNKKIKFGEFHIHHHYRKGDSKQKIWETGFNHLFYIFTARIFKENYLIDLAKTFVKIVSDKIKLSMLSTNYLE